MVNIMIDPGLAFQPLYNTGSGEFKIILKGYAEPSICFENEKDNLVINDKIYKEIFINAIVRELKEVFNLIFIQKSENIRIFKEINIDTNSFDAPELLGILVNSQNNNSPNLQFFVKSKLTSVELTELYCKNSNEEGALESDEVSIYFTCGMLIIILKFCNRSYFWIKIFSLMIEQLLN